MSEHTPGIEKKKSIRVVGDAAYIPLTKGYEAVIDAADVHLVEGFSWCADVHGNTVYALRRDYRNGCRRAIRMHRVLLCEPEDFDVDHKDGDGLNNRRLNLRLATAIQNKRNTKIASHNTSGFKGVTFHKQTGKWHAQIQHLGRHISLGLHQSPEAAHEAYCKGSSQYHGEFGRTA